MSMKNNEQKTDQENLPENVLNKQIKTLMDENRWLKQELNSRFSSEEHQTIAFMLGKAQIELLTGKTTFKGFSLNLLNIYSKSLHRKSVKNNLNLLNKIILLILEESLKESAENNKILVKPSNNLQKISIENKPQKSLAEIIKNNKRDTPIEDIKDLRISAIMDEFTYKSYKDECNIDQLSIYSWGEQLEAFKPDIFFVESAWRGFNDEWDRKVATLSSELLGAIQWCNDNNIPVIFWNKEDPIHFQTFINLAKKVDYVFTTDVDCIEKYKSILRHNNVYWLPFAAQVSVNNPIEKYKREDAFCFAGAYYVKYPERTKDLNNFVENFSKVKPLIIYDRNYHKNDENYKFPENFKFFIKGNLPYDQIDKAYKGYNYSINLNSIKQSQSMFARRVFEVLASNTILVSNYSRGLRVLFGDLVASSDNANYILSKLDNLFNDQIKLDLMRLLALRKVLAEHTYYHRLEYIVNKTLSIDFTTPENVLVIGVLDEKNGLEVILENFNRQKVENKKLIILDKNRKLTNIQRNEFLNLVSFEDISNYLSQNNIQYVSYFSCEDYYGEYYLYDLILATKYSKNSIIGKSKYLKAVKNEFSEIVGGECYKFNEAVYFRNALLTEKIFLQNIERFESEDLDKIVWDDNTFSIDYFNYCQNFYKFKFKYLPKVLKQIEIDTGLSILDYEKMVEKPFVENENNHGLEINSLVISKWFAKPVNKLFTLKYNHKGLEISSSLESNKHDYYYSMKPLTIKELSLIAGKKQKVYLDVEPGLNLQMVFKYLDSNKNNISHQMLVGLKNDELEIPKDCSFISIGFRIYGKGSGIIKGLKLNHQIIEPAFVISKNKYIVVTNHYPSYDDLYRNGFVHSRVKSYLNNGIKADVFRLRKNQPVSYHEFEGIDVTTGSADALTKMIQYNDYQTIMVHFLDNQMWDILSKFANTHRIIIWVHGAEIQAWYRRAFNYETEAQEQQAKNLYENRAKFWKGIIQNLPENLHFVFVSQYFADEVMRDLDVQIPRNQYSVVPNPINTELFKYQTKHAEMRKKILSIRPYASKTYANDLTVKAILELSKEKFFDELEFRLVGDGVLFDETVEPLKIFKNVIIEKKFLTHGEISNLHKEYGIFLCPSRMDTQGVSRDEAMSSGLVPITNSVGAIPEFLKDFPSLLVEPEDYIGLANKIKEFYLNPNEFCKISKRVGRSLANRTHRVVIKKELDLVV